MLERVSCSGVLARSRISSTHFPPLPACANPSRMLKSFGYPSFAGKSWSKQRTGTEIWETETRSYESLRENHRTESKQTLAHRYRLQVTFVDSSDDFAQGFVRARLRLPNLRLPVRCSRPALSSEDGLAKRVSAFGRIRAGWQRRGNVWTISPSETRRTTRKRGSSMRAPWRRI